MAKDSEKKAQVGFDRKTKAELIDEALLKHVAGGNTCGGFVNTCYDVHGVDTCYTFVDWCSEQSEK